jgi:hypothetical protein
MRCRSVEPGGGPEKREAALLLTREQLDGRAENLGRRDEQLFPVGGVASGAGGRGPDALDTGGVHDVAVLAQHRQGALDGVGVEPPAGVNALPEPGDVHVPLNGAERPARTTPIAVGDQKPGGVRPHVDRRQPAHPSPPDSDRRSPTQRPTGSTPPARNHA